MVGLAAPSEIRGITVCAFMLFDDGYKNEAHILTYVIPENCYPLARWRLPTWDLFSSFLTPVLSFFHSVFF